MEVPPISGHSATARQYCRRNSHRGPHATRNTTLHQPCLCSFHTSRTEEHPNRESLFRSDQINPQGNQERTEKGTEVEIMIPAVSDIAFTPDASFYIAHKLMKKGAKIYLFNGGFHHSKIMMVDSTSARWVLPISTAAACAMTTRQTLSSSTPRPPMS